VWKPKNLQKSDFWISLAQNGKIHPRKVSSRRIFVKTLRKVIILKIPTFVTVKAVLVMKWLDMKILLT
jgi:hypothetical protein